MIDHDDSMSPRFTPTAGDPSLQLFGQGWTPTSDSAAGADSYVGRHRAPEE
jgi:hypothetical protein